MEQQDVDLSKAIDKAKQEVWDVKVVGAFLVLPDHVGQQARQQQTGDQQGQLFAKAYAVDQNDQLRVLRMDAKDNKVVQSDTRQRFFSPWLSSAGISGMRDSQQGMDGSQQGQSGQPSGQPRSQQPGMGGSQQRQSGQSGGSGY